MELVALSRRVNDGQVGIAIETLEAELGSLAGRRRPRPRTDLPGGREGARLLAGAPPHRAALHGAGARVSAWDPLLTDAEVERLRSGAVGVGNAERRPRDRRADGGSGLPAPRPGLVREPRGHPRRPEQPARSRPSGAPSGSSGSVSRRGRESAGTCRLIPARRAATGEDRQRCRDSSPAHQGGGAPPRAAGAPRCRPRRHRAALGRADGRGILRGAGPAPPGLRARGGRWWSRRPDGSHACRVGARAAGRGARRGPRLRRHELHPGRHAGCREARHPRRARGGGPAIASTDGCRRRSTGWWRITSRPGASPRRSPPSRTSPTKASRPAWSRSGT